MFTRGFTARTCIEAGFKFMRKINLIGQRFGRLLVISEAPKGKWGKLQYLCKCDCGKISINQSGYLRAGDTKSCGCNKFWKAHNQNGNKHWNWQGDSISYKGLHLWVHKTLGSSSRCEHCGFQSNSNRKIHWANKSHQYKRETSDWLRLCVSCHKKYDKKLIIKVK